MMLDEMMVSSIVGNVWSMIEAALSKIQSTGCMHGNKKRATAWSSKPDQSGTGKHYKHGINKAWFTQSTMTIDIYLKG